MVTSALMLGAACGSRLTEEELRLVDAGGAGNGASAPAAQSGQEETSGEEPANGDSGKQGDAGATTPENPSNKSAGVESVSSGFPAGASPSPTGATGGGATDVGVTRDRVLIGNVATVSGPVPGLFRGAVAGTQAFAAYQNSRGGVFGRKLVVKTADDRLDGGQNRAHVAALSKEVFAFVGSFSVTDEGGVEELEANGVPDVSFALSRSRQRLATNFSPQPLAPGWRLGPLNYFKEKFGEAVTKKVAGFYTDVASARDAYNGQRAAATATGWEYVYERPLSTAESNYTTDALRMRERGAQAIFMSSDVTNIARMAKAIEQQGVELTLPNYNANAYDARFIELAGSAAEGALIDQMVNMYLGEDREQIPEIGLFLTWMKKAAPGVQPDLFAAFSWASGRLFVQALEAAGPSPTRAGLLGELSKIDDFDANGMLAPAGPASKRPPSCFIIIKVVGGRFVRADPPTGMICDKGGHYRPPGT